VGTNTHIIRGLKDTLPWISACGLEVGLEIGKTRRLAFLSKFYRQCEKVAVGCTKSDYPTLHRAVRFLSGHRLGGAGLPFREYCASDLACRLVVKEFATSITTPSSSAHRLAVHATYAALASSALCQCCSGHMLALVSRTAFDTQLSWRRLLRSATYELGGDACGR